MPNNDHLQELKRVVHKCISDDVPLDMGVFWHPCGTFGCLAGWAARDKYFGDIGLQVLPGTYAGNPVGVLIWWRKQNGVPYAIRDFAALEELYGLDDYQSRYLFGTLPDVFDSCVDWHEALERIEEVIRGEV